MPSSLGPAEILVILVVALIVLGPSRLPEAGRQVGKALTEIRRWTHDVKSEMTDAFQVEPPMAPMPTPVPQPQAVTEPPAAPGEPSPSEPAPAPADAAPVASVDGPPLDLPAPSAVDAPPAPPADNPPVAPLAPLAEAPSDDPA